MCFPSVLTCLNLSGQTSPSEPLGDIVICPVVIEAEAREQLKTVEDHWTHMLVHGFYHLIGYDHMTESESATMEALGN